MLSCDRIESAKFIHGTLSLAKQVYYNYRKWMMEIWSESAKFNTNQAKLILKEGWLPELEILEICEQVNREEYTQKEPLKQIETQNIEN